MHISGFPLDAGPETDWDRAYQSAREDNLKLLEDIIKRDEPLIIKESYDILRIAVEFGSITVSKFLLNERNIEPKFDIIEKACYSGNIELLESLFKTVKVSKKKLNDLLRETCEFSYEEDGKDKSGHLDCVKFLVEKGADFNSYVYEDKPKYEEENWNSAFMHAVSSERKDIIEYLVNQGADIRLSTYTENFWNPYHKFIKQDIFDYTEDLISKRA